MPIEVSVTDQNVQVSTSGQTVNASVSGGVGPAGPTGATGATGATGPAGTTTWAGITDKPATFAPSTHASSHASAGSDPITVGTVSGRFVTTTTGGKLATTQYIGLSQILNGMGTPATSLDTMIADIATYGNPYTINGSGQMQPPAHVHDTADITSGTLATARLASGTASASTYLRGDQTWAAISTYTLPAATTSTLGGVTYGTTAGTACQGNDSRLSDARTPTSHVHAASDITSGTLATERLGSGTATPLSFLAGNQTWRTFSFIPGFSGLADADDWASRVVANGGSVSDSTMDAVYRLCMQLSSAGLRQRFFRVGIFAGSGLNAALVPLYRGPSLSGTQYGHATDTNVGPFVSSDYAEDAGLTGNGSSKYLDTGFPMNTLPSTTSGHAAVSCKNRSSTSAFCGMVGVNLAGGSGFGVATDATVYAQWGSFANASNNANGLLVASRTSATSLVAYAAGAAIATTSTSTTPTASTLNAAVFVSRNSASSHTFFDARTYGFYSIGTGLSAAEVSALTNAVNVFQATLGRDP
jgi:hypothetical protein